MSETLGMADDAMKRKDNAELYLCCVGGLTTEKLEADRKVIMANPNQKYASVALRAINTELVTRLAKELFDTDDAVKWHWLNFASQYLLNAGFEDASYALDCEFNLLGGRK